MVRHKPLESAPSTEVAPDVNGGANTIEGASPAEGHVDSSSGVNLGVVTATRSIERGRARGRLKFSREEDSMLAQWVQNNPHLKAMGEQIWKQAERSNLTRHGWASMQNRWRRYCSHRSISPGRRDPASSDALHAPETARSRSRRDPTRGSDQRHSDIMQALHEASTSSAMGRVPAPGPIIDCDVLAEPFATCQKTIEQALSTAELLKSAPQWVQDIQKIMPIDLNHI